MEFNEGDRVYVCIYFIVVLNGVLWSGFIYFFFFSGWIVI